MTIRVNAYEFRSALTCYRSPKGIHFKNELLGKAFGCCRGRASIYPFVKRLNRMINVRKQPYKLKNSRTLRVLGRANSARPFYLG